MTPDSEAIWHGLRALRPSLPRWNIKRLRVFGSVARGEAGPSSDVDLIADFDPKPSLLGLVRIQEEMGESLGRRVDLFTEPSIWRYIRDQVTAEARLVE
jgi:hypothetical protein